MQYVIIEFKDRLNDHFVIEGPEVSRDEADILWWGLLTGTTPEWMLECLPENLHYLVRGIKPVVKVMQLELIQNMMDLCEIGLVNDLIHPDLLTDFEEAQVKGSQFKPGIKYCTSKRVPGYLEELKPNGDGTWSCTVGTFNNEGAFIRGSLASEERI